MILAMLYSLNALSHGEDSGDHLGLFDEPVDGFLDAWGRIDPLARGHLLKLDLFSYGISSFSVLSCRGVNQFMVTWSWLLTTILCEWGAILMPINQGINRKISLSKQLPG